MNILSVLRLLTATERAHAEARSGAGEHRLSQQSRREAEALAQFQCSIRKPEMSNHQQVVDELGAGPRPYGTEVNNGVRMGLVQRTRTSLSLRLGTDQDK